MSEYERAKAAAVVALGVIDPKQPFGTELFNGIARLSISVALEAMVIRERDGQTEIYLAKRGEDEAYPGQWHAPGSIMRPGETWQKVVDRLALGEFGCRRASILAGQCVHTVNWSEYCVPGDDVWERGHILSFIYLVELDSNDPPQEDETHGWYSVDDLPSPMVVLHNDVLIPLAITAFKE